MSPAAQPLLDVGLLELLRTQAAQPVSAGKTIQLSYPSVALGPT